MSKIYYSKYVVGLFPQTEFYVEKAYIPNTKSLFVYYNGALLASADDYTEVDEHTIRLNFEPQKDDVIIISPLAVNNVKTRQSFDGHLRFDEFEIKRKQSEFKLKNKYVPGTNTLMVYVNGMVLKQEKIIEVDSETVRILSRLEVGDKVVIAPTIKVGNNIDVLRKGILNKDKWNKYEEFIIKEEERVFNLQHSYEPNTKSIKVFFNGILLDSRNYDETDHTTVTLKFFPEPNDIVVIARVPDSDANITSANGDIVGSKPDSMFHRYGSEERLMPNQRYTLGVFFDGKQHEFTFTSRYAPYYCTAKLIHMDLHEFTESIDEEIINFTIWQNSKLLEELFEDALKDKDKKTNIKNWTRYKTELDLINSVYINIASRAGNSQKTLGNMQVSKSIKIPYLDEMLKIITRKLDAEEAKLSGRKIAARAARKANGTDYPISPERRSF